MFGCISTVKPSTLFLPHPQWSLADAHCTSQEAKELTARHPAPSGRKQNSADWPTPLQEAGSGGIQTHLHEPWRSSNPIHFAYITKNFSKYCYPNVSVSLLFGGHHKTILWCFYVQNKSKCAFYWPHYCGIKLCCVQKNCYKRPLWKHLPQSAHSCPKGPHIWNEEPGISPSIIVNASHWVLLGRLKNINVEGSLVSAVWKMIFTFELIIYLQE